MYTAIYVDSTNLDIVGQATVETVYAPDAIFVDTSSELTIPGGAKWRVDKPNGAGGYTNAYDLRFQPRVGQQLGVGTYTDVRLVPDASHPGLSVSFANRGCEALLGGSFTIHELARDGSGAIVAFAASFEQACFGGGALFGELRVDSVIPFRAVQLGAAHQAFGEQDVLTTSGPLPVTVRNTGVLPVTMSSSITGPAAGDYAVASDACSPVPLAPGATCTITVTFRPTDILSREASLLIDDDTLRGSRLAALIGSGMGPTTTTLTVSPTPGEYPIGVMVTATVARVVSVSTNQAPSGPVQIFSESGNHLATGYASGWWGQSPFLVILPPGTTTIRAVFLGEGPYRPSTSAWIDHGVLAGTTITLTPETNGPEFGVPFSIHAHLETAGTAAAPSGVLTITDDTTGRTLGQVTVSELVADLVVTAQFFDLEIHTITAHYSGGGIAASSSTSMLIYSRRAEVGISAWSVGTPSSSQPTTVAVRLDPVPPAGSITVSVNGGAGSTLGAAPTDGTVEFLVQLDNGSNSVQVSYSGDSFYAASTRTIMISVP